MDSIERKALRERAERERDDDSSKSAHYAQARSPAWWALMESLDGTRVLALLDALEAAEREHGETARLLDRANWMVGTAAIAGVKWRRIGTDDGDATVPERDELAAEVAAYQGRPEGALEGWVPYLHSQSWRRRLDDGLVLEVRAQYTLDGAPTHRWTWEIKGLVVDDAPTPRAAMRAAEDAARARGLL